MLIHTAIQKIDSLLLQKNIITVEQLANFKKVAAEKNQSLLFSLFTQEIICEETYLHIIQFAFDLEETKKIKVHLSQIDFSILNFSEIKTMHMLPIKEKEKTTLIFYDPSHINYLNHIKFRCKTSLAYILISFSLFQKIIQELEMQHIQPISPIKRSLPNKELDPLIELINLTIFSAIHHNASDIHFEPYQHYYRIRMRINGLLEERRETEQQVDQRIAARLKILANLDTTERRLPQDGQFQIQYQKQFYNIRMSTCPTIYGEKIVLRILYRQQKRSLSELGMNESQLHLFLTALNKPQGLILVCGPTGSGKTVTLYAAIDYLNQPQKNILTVEDPVEIQLNGINQVAINPILSLSFQQVLRSFLRLDPDIIMVGEMRDSETAQTTIKASQTGHLALSTLHSNSALKALTRLRHMGIRDYDIADSISLIISQRLLRKLCIHCKKKTIPSKNMQIQFNLSNEQVFYQATGCSHCLHGYQERFAVYEVIPFCDQLANLFLTHKTVFQLEKHLSELNILRLQESALSAAKAGITSLEEIKRVIF